VAKLGDSDEDRLDLRELQARVVVSLDQIIENEKVGNRIALWARQLCDFVPESKG